MSEWKKCKLGDVVILNYGKSLPVKKRKNGDIPVYSSAGLIGWHDKSLVDSKGLIIGRKGTIGKFTNHTFHFILLIPHIMFCQMIMYMILSFYSFYFVQLA